MRAELDYAAEIRMRVADRHCPVKIRTGEHNNLEMTHWFRRLAVCATCGYVERVTR